MSGVAVWKIPINRTLRPLNAVVYWDREKTDPVDWATYTPKFLLEKQDGTVELTEADSAALCTAHPTQAFTASATTDLLTKNAHGVKEGQQVVVANSGGVLPTGLTAATRYFAVQVTQNAFALAALPQGAPIDITGAGTGTHTFFVVGSVQVDLATEDVDTAGVYYGWFSATSGSDTWLLPEGEDWIEIRVQNAGN
jgi:hypothetical protein